MKRVLHLLLLRRLAVHESVNLFAHGVGIFLERI
jgi:hypothetical protein